MRITLDLEPADIERFDEALARYRAGLDSVDEVDIVEAAKYAIDHLCATPAPAYVRQRLVELQRLVVMLEDEAWALSQPDRGEVIATLAYFSDPDDLIPDHTDIVGFLDDAIVLELLLQRLRRVRVAYKKFCVFRDAAPSAVDVVGRQRAARALAEYRSRLTRRWHRRPATARPGANTPILGNL